MSFIYFIVLISVIVTVHELGHLLAAKKFGVYCHEFSIGIGPKLFSKKFKETTYSIRLLPIGGFVAMAGDNENALETKVEVNVPFHRTLPGIKTYQKIIIMLAGVMMNFILSIFVVMSLLIVNKVHIKAPLPIVDEVVAGSVASEVGFLKGDKILKVELENGVVIKPKNGTEMVAFLASESGLRTYTVLRDQQEITINVTPTYSMETETYVVGIRLVPGEKVKVTILNAFGYTMEYLLDNANLIFKAIGQLFLGRGLQNLSGPVGIYNATAKASNLGFTSFLSMLALISLNIGIANLLPLPILDGGRVVITLLESIFKKPINKKIEMALMSISMILLLMLVIYSTYRDIIRLS